MSLKRARSASPELTAHVSASPEIQDRSSRFIGLYSPTLSNKELRSRRDIQDATHRIAAWRRPSSQRSLSSRPLIESGHDDDGEKYGGRTVEKVMEAMDIQGTVIVARWYGGVMLGPVRFDHIRDCAKAAISKWLNGNENATKKNKIDSEDEEKKRLEALLQERDESIAVLRGLLAEKKQTSSQQSSSPSKVPDYSKQPLQVLRKLEDVRDATIGWILKAIEDADKGTDAAEQPNVEKEASVEEAAKEPKLTEQAKVESNTHDGDLISLSTD